MDAFPPFDIPENQAGLTLAAVLRIRLPGLSWRQVRDLIAARRIHLGGEVCLDPARRVAAGDTVEMLVRAASRPRETEGIVLRYLDEHVVVVEKPAGLCTVRHPTERDWSEKRKSLTPTLEDLVPRAIASREGQRSVPRMRIVQRLDKETSGLVVFARTILAERDLGKQFHAHTVVRRYFAVVPGQIEAGQVRTFLVRDRGDGRRGSTTVNGVGQEAITHVEVIERLGRHHTLVRCRLETGRTHQIRIHLSELGHPVCGDPVYVHRREGGLFADHSGAPRLALHAAELGFRHPYTQETLHWEMPLPADLAALVERLRGGRAPGTARPVD